MTQTVNNFYADKVALITGAASGIGFALAQELAKKQCRVIMVDLDSIAPLPFDPNNLCQRHKLDVCDRAAYEKLFNEVTTQFGRLDFIFNNAGIAIGGPAAEYDNQEWQKTIDVNILGVTNGIHLAYQYMRNQGFGHIINTSSIVSLFPNVLTPMYSASKAAITVLGQQLQLEAKAFGVNIHTLAPGAIDTPILTGGLHGRAPHGVSTEQLLRYWQRMRPMPAEQFAQQALRAIAHGEHLIILPQRWRYLVWLSRFLPPFWLWYSRKVLSERTRNATTEFTANKESNCHAKS